MTEHLLRDKAKADPAPRTRAESLKTDVGAALQFIDGLRWSRGLAVVLTSIREGEPLAGAFFTPDRRDACASWIAARNGDGGNIYYTVNIATRASVQKNLPKLKRDHIRWAAALHADLDVPKDATDIPAARADLLARVRAFSKAPTVTVFSGGGYQALWLFQNPVAVANDPASIEAYNRGIAEALRSDRVHNLDRIMRLPGTVNWPDAKKRKRGRVPALAHVVEADWSRAYALTDFAAWQLEPERGAKPGGDATVVAFDPANLPAFDLDALPVDDMTKCVALQGYDFAVPQRWEGDRSRAVFHVACMMARAGCDDPLIAAVLLDPNLGVSAHVRERGGRDPAGYARRQIERAREWIAKPRPGAKKHAK